MLGANFPGSYYSGDEAKSYDMFGYFNNQRQTEEAFANQELNRQAALQDYLFNEQANPYKLKDLELGNRTKEASLEDQLYRNKQSGRDWEVRSNIPVQQEVKSKLVDMAAKMSDAEWKQTENGIRQMMVSPSANERQMGQLLYKMMPAMVQQREQLASKEELARIREEARAQAAKDAATARMAQIERQAELRRQQLSIGKDPKSYEEAAVRYRNAAENAEDDATQQKFLLLAREFESAALALKQAAGAGKVDVGTMAGVPTREVSPQLGGKLKPEQESWIDRAMKANPGMTREQIIEEGKKRGKL